MTNVRQATDDELEEEARRRRREEELRHCTEPGVLLSRATEAMGLQRSEVMAVVKLEATPPVWEVRTTAGTLTVNSDELFSHRKFKRRLGEATNEVLASMKPDAWDDVAGMLMRAATVASIGEEATDAGACRSWLVDYLERTPPAGEDFDESTILLRCPFRDEDGAVYVFGPSLRSWVYLYRGERVTAKRMGVVLRAGGCEDVQLDRMVNGKRRAARVWRVPVGLVEPVHHHPPLGGLVARA